MQILPKSAIRAVTTLTLLAFLSCSCVSLFQAQTPLQRVYAAVTEYEIVLSGAADYALTPYARPDLVLRLVELDTQGQLVIDQILMIAQSPRHSRLARDRESALDDLAHILRFLKLGIIQVLIEAGEAA